MKYVDASALLRILFDEAGARVPLGDDERVVSSDLVEVEMCRAVDRERLLGNLDDAETGRKRKELDELVAMLDLVPIDRAVVELARASFGVNVRALDAIHVASAQVIARSAPGETLSFWTHDDRQATAALARGLNVHGV